MSDKQTEGYRESIRQQTQDQADAIAERIRATDPSDPAAPVLLDACGIDGISAPYHFASCPGLTKREWFAGQALNGLCWRAANNTPNDIAHDAVLFADALIAALNKEPEK